MLPAVHFDDYHFFRADKVNDKRADGILTPEFKAAKSAVSEMIPKQPFGIGQPFPQGPDEFPIRCHPSPQPSPLPGERELLDAV